MPPSNVEQAFEALRNNVNFNIIVSWMEGQKELALKTFSAPVPADQLYAHFHVGGRISAFEEILSAVRVARSK